MDLSIFLNDDFDSVLAIESIKKMAANRKRNTVLLRVFLGATRQDEAFTRAIALAKSELLQELNIYLEDEVFSQDHVKNTLRWTVSQLIDWLLAADIHLVPCHIHEGNISKTSSWNVENIRAQASRLKFHLGLPMGQHIDCAVWNGDKFELSAKTSSESES